MRRLRVEISETRKVTPAHIINEHHDEVRTICCGGGPAEQAKHQRELKEDSFHVTKEDGRSWPALHPTQHVSLFAMHTCAHQFVN